MCTYVQHCCNYITNLLSITVPLDGVNLADFFQLQYCRRMLVDGCILHYLFDLPSFGYVATNFKLMSHVLYCTLYGILTVFTSGVAVRS